MLPLMPPIAVSTLLMLPVLVSWRLLGVLPPSPAPDRPAPPGSYLADLE